MATLKYANEPISEAFIRKSGLPPGAMTARVKMDEEPVDTLEEILPDTISEVGVKIDQNAAGALITAFFRKCIEYMCREARNTRIGDFLSLYFSTRGSGVKLSKSDRIDKKDVGIGVHLLKGSFDYKFKLKNLVDGIEIALHSATGVTEGRTYKTFAAGENVRINGENLKLLEGDKVELYLDDELVGECTQVESAVDHIIVTPPAVAAAIPAGTKVEFRVTSRGGDPSESLQTKRTEATVAAYSGNPIIAYFEQAGKERNEFGVDANAIVTIKGAGFTRPNIISAKFGKLEAGGNSFAYAFNPTAITVIDANTVTCKVSAAEDPDQTDETLAADSAAGLIVLRAFTQMTRSNDLVAHYVA